MGEGPSLRVLRPQDCAWVRSSHLLRGPLCATTHLDGQRARSLKGREPNQCLGARTPFSSTTLQPVQLRDSEARHVLSLEATAAPPRERQLSGSHALALERGGIDEKGQRFHCFEHKQPPPWVYMLGYPAACPPT